MTVPFFGSQAFRGKTLGHLRAYSWLVRGQGEVKVSWWGDRIGRVERSQAVGSASR